MYLIVMEFVFSDLSVTPQKTARSIKSQKIQINTYCYVKYHEFQMLDFYNVSMSDDNIRTTVKETARSNTTTENHPINLQLTRF